MVVVVVPRQHEAAPVFVDMPRDEVLRLATSAAQHLDHKLASTEADMQAEELARRKRWNAHWWVRALPLLKANTRPESIDVWDIGRGDVLAGLDDVFELTWMKSYAESARRIATRATRSESSHMPVEEKFLNVMRNWADR